MSTHFSGHDKGKKKGSKKGHSASGAHHPHTPPKTSASAGRLRENEVRKIYSSYTFMDQIPDHVLDTLLDYKDMIPENIYAKLEYEADIREYDDIERELNRAINEAIWTESQQTKGKYTEVAGALQSTREYVPRLLATLKNANFRHGRAGDSSELVKHFYADVDHLINDLQMDYRSKYPEYYTELNRLNDAVLKVLGLSTVKHYKRTGIGKQGGANIAELTFLLQRLRAPAMSTRRRRTGTASARQTTQTYDVSDITRNVPTMPTVPTGNVLISGNAPLTASTIPLTPPTGNYPSGSMGGPTPGTSHLMTPPQQMLPYIGVPSYVYTTQPNPNVGTAGSYSNVPATYQPLPLTPSSSDRPLPPTAALFTTPISQPSSQPSQFPTSQMPNALSQQPISSLQQPISSLPPIMPFIAGMHPQPTSMSQWAMPSAQPSSATATRTPSSAATAGGTGGLGLMGGNQPSSTHDWTRTNALQQQYKIEEERIFAEIDAVKRAQAKENQRLTETLRSEMQRFNQSNEQMVNSLNNQFTTALGQQNATFTTALEQQNATIGNRFRGLDTSISGFDNRISGLESSVNRLNSGLAELNSAIDQRVDGRLDRYRTENAAREERRNSDITSVLDARERKLRKEMDDMFTAQAERQSRAEAIRAASTDKAIEDSVRRSVQNVTTNITRDISDNTTLHNNLANNETLHRSVGNTVATNRNFANTVAASDTLQQNISRNAEFARTVASDTVLQRNLANNLANNATLTNTVATSVANNRDFQDAVARNQNLRDSVVTSLANDQAIQQTIDRSVLRAMSTVQQPKVGGAADTKSGKDLKLTDEQLREQSRRREAELAIKQREDQLRRDELEQIKRDFEGKLAAIERKRQSELEAHGNAIRALEARENAMREQADRLSRIETHLVLDPSNSRPNRTAIDALNHRLDRLGNTVERIHERTTGIDAKTIGESMDKIDAIAERATQAVEIATTATQLATAANTRTTEMGTALNQSIARQGETLNRTLEERLAAQRENIANDFAARLKAVNDKLAADVATNATNTAALGRRVTALETRPIPVPVPPPAVAVPAWLANLAPIGNSGAVNINAIANAPARLDALQTALVHQSHVSGHQYNLHKQVEMGLAKNFSEFANRDPNEQYAWIDKALPPPEIL